MRLGASLFHPTRKAKRRVGPVLQLWREHGAEEGSEGYTRPITRSEHSLSHQIAGSRVRRYVSLRALPLKPLMPMPGPVLMSTHVDLQTTQPKNKHHSRSFVVLFFTWLSSTPFDRHALSFTILLHSSPLVDEEATSQVTPLPLRRPSSSCLEASPSLRPC